MDLSRSLPPESCTKLVASCWGKVQGCRSLPATRLKRDTSTLPPNTASHHSPLTSLRTPLPCLQRRIARPAHVCDRHPPTMLGRGTNLLRPLRARLPFRCMPLSSRHYDLAIRPLIPSAHRCFAEAVRKPGRPKKAVGEPSRPVKRAVKRAAKAPADAEAATKQVKAKKAAAEKKAAKPKPKAQAKPKKKEPTEAQLAAKKKRLVSAELKELKQAALHPPRRTKIGARSEWLRDFYTAPAQVEPRPTDHDHAAIKAWFADASRRAVEEWRHVTPEQLEVRLYTRLATSSRTDSPSALQPQASRA